MNSLTTRVVPQMAVIGLGVFATVIAAAATESSATRVAEVEFSGYMRAGGDTRFVLTDPSRLVASGWLVLGEAFSGYVLEAFELEREILVVRKSGEAFRLPLKDGKVLPSNSADPQLKEHRIVIGGDGRILISGELIDAADLGRYLERIAASDPATKFKLTVYRSVEGDKKRVESIAKAIPATIKDLPGELRRRFPFVVLRPQMPK